MPGLEIVWRAFELRPEPAPMLDPESDYLRQAWNRSVVPIAVRLGMRMRMPGVIPRSRLAHEAAAWARARGEFETMHEAIFRSYFELGEDIGREEVLAGQAAASGLDGDGLRKALQNHDHLPEVLEDERRAAQLGLTGVPTFVAGARTAFGVQDADTLEKLVVL